nr:unnamed protein product [Digitaria exilis]
MDLEARNNSPPPARSSKTKTTHRLMVALNCALLGVGVTGGQLLSRLYYSKGGHRQWLSAWLQTGAWPLLLIPLAISYSTRRARDGRGAPLLLSPPRVLLAAAGLGLSTGVDDFLYAWGLEFLPVSTSAILISTQLAFTVLFAFLVVGQRLTPATMNAVALLTVGAVVLGLHVSGDRPEGVTRGQYWMGFVLTLGAAVLYGLILPLVELAYNRAAAAGGGGALTYAVAMELQLVMGFVATVFCTVGMVVNKDFQQGYAYGVDDFIYAYGLPTNSRVHLRDPHLEFSTHLVFTVCFAFLIVGHRQTPATVNAVALLTADAVVLGHPRGAHARARSSYLEGATKLSAAGVTVVSKASSQILHLDADRTHPSIPACVTASRADQTDAPRRHSSPPPAAAMDVEAPRKDSAAPARGGNGKAMHRLLVALNIGMLALGAIGGPLLSRLYFSKGGHRQWLSAWLETGGWPLLLIPVAASYAARRARHGRGAPLLLTPPRILLAAAALGVATGVDDFIYAYGLAYLPVSTSAILISTQLAFTVLFAFLVVRQRLTPASVNAVALLTVGAVVLGLHVSGDRPPGVTRGQYWVGFVLTLGAAALYGLVLPLVELAYRRAAGGGRAVTYALVMEMQLVMGFFATAFCTVGMVVNKDFQAIPREAKHFELGEGRYYTVLAWAAVLWQFFFLGAVGVIFCVHTLLAGILIAVFIPVTEVAAVIFLHEKFSSEKGVALVLSLWGLASYSYGEWSEARAKKQTEAAAEAQASS